jgi:hypothetical protein
MYDVRQEQYMTVIRELIRHEDYVTPKQPRKRE